MLFTEEEESVSVAGDGRQDLTFENKARELNVKKERKAISLKGDMGSTELILGQRGIRKGCRN